MPADLPLAGQTIGFVGLGNMGFPMARHLQAAGAKVIVWNRSPAPLATATAAGLTPASSLIELAHQVGNGLIGLSLTTTEVIESVVFGPQGLATALHDDALILDFGTTAVSATRRFAKQRPWLDVPVSGGQLGAINATLTIFVGGSESHYRRALPMLQVLGQRITHLGPSGSGQVTKLANQLIVAQTIDAVAQALSLAKRAGVDPALVREALLGGFAESRVLQLHGERMIKGDFTPGGRAEHQLKDVRLACELATHLGLESATLQNCLQQWERFVLESKGGDLDHSALIQLYQKPTGSNA